MTKLGSVLADLVDCEHKTAPIDEAGRFFAVGTPAMAGNRIDFSQARRISEETFAEWTRRMAPAAGDILLAREAPVGPVVVIPTEANVAPGQRTVLMRPDSKAVDARYLYFALAAPATQAALQEKAAGSTVAHLNVADIRAFEFSWAFPKVATQSAIAEVLSALDDKIAINKTVETSADAVVRALYEGLRADETTTIGALFANPRASVKPPIDAAVYVGLEHVARRRMWLDESGDVDGLLSGKFYFERDDVLFGKLRPYFHKVVVSDRHGVCSTDILVLRPLRADMGGYCWAAVSSDSVVERVSALSAGTRMPRTSWADLAACEVVWPGESLARAFSARVIAIRDRVSAGLQESRQLAALRDTLLPHLMSGRITVGEAQKRVEEVL